MLAFIYKSEDYTGLVNAVLDAKSEVCISKDAQNVYQTNDSDITRRDYPVNNGRNTKVDMVKISTRNRVLAKNMLEDFFENNKSLLDESKHVHVKPSLASMSVDVGVSDFSREKQDEFGYQSSVSDLFSSVLSDDVTDAGWSVIEEGFLAGLVEAEKCMSHEAVASRNIEPIGSSFGSSFAKSSQTSLDTGIEF